MNKYFNPRLLNAVIAGTGMKHPVRPHVILGDQENGFVRGDLMDANAILEFMNQKIAELVNNAPETLDTLKELADAIEENGVADLVTKGQLEAALGDKVDKSDMSTMDANGHDYVEIGGIKWATMNIGANSVTDTGLYFQWGDTQGYTADQVGNGEGKKYFGWEDYKYGNGTSLPSAAGMTKYNATDGKTVLDTEDDAAVANWGGSWRMPTTEELQALGAAVNTAWTADYQGSGVAGLVCTDKTDSSKVLFFPAAGYCVNGDVKHVGDDGYCWSRSLYTSNRQNAYDLGFFIYAANWGQSFSRYYGYTVRGVLDAEDKYATKAEVEEVQSTISTQLDNKEDKTDIVVKSTAISTLTTEVGKYYRLDTPVETLAITLPTMTDNSIVKSVVLYLTGGTTPAVTFTSTHDVYYADGFEIESGSTYEVNALWNGAAWIVASVTIIVE